MQAPARAAIRRATSGIRYSQSDDQQSHGADGGNSASQSVQTVNQIVRRL